VPSVALPPSIAQELKPLLGPLAAHGFKPTLAEQSASFGNFEVVFASASASFSVVRDRGQFHVDRVDQSVLESAGLWRSFSGPQSLVKPLLAWLEAKSAA
jgi:hypothetical protein